MDRLLYHKLISLYKDNQEITTILEDSFIKNLRIELVLARIIEMQASTILELRSELSVANARLRSENG